MNPSSTEESGCGKTRNLKLYVLQAYRFAIGDISRPKVDDPMLNDLLDAVEQDPGMVHKLRFALTRMGALTDAERLIYMFQDRLPLSDLGWCPDESLSTWKRVEFNSDGALTKLNLNEMPLGGTLDMSEFEYLAELSCEGAQLDALTVSNNLYLRRLYCGDNNLKYLDLCCNRELRILSAHSNQISNLDVSTNGQLSWLNVSSNPLTRLNVIRNADLTHLDCGRCQLTSLDLDTNVKLKSLWCEFNQLVDLYVADLPDLTYIRIEGNRRLAPIQLPPNAVRIQVGDRRLTCEDTAKLTGCKKN